MKSFTLDNEPKIRTGFKTPEGYFEGLTEKVMHQLPGQEVKVVPLYRKKPVWITAAAAVLAIALSLTFYFRGDTAQMPDDAAIENYLVYQANISTYELMQGLDETDIAELEQSVEINDEAIEDYLSTQPDYDIYLNE